MWKPFTAALCAALLLALGATPAFAHVAIDPREAPAHSYARLTLRVPHGCEGSPTTAVAVQIPDGVVAVKPELVPGWRYATEVGELAEPVELNGEQLTEGVREVRWFGGPPIPDEAFLEFGLSVRLPDRAGETLYFPVLQTCEQGEHAWVERPAEGQDAHALESPAPALRLTQGGGHDGAATVADAPGEGTADAEPPTLAVALDDAESTAGQARLLAAIALAVALVAVALEPLRRRRKA